MCIYFLLIDAWQILLLLCMVCYAWLQAPISLARCIVRREKKKIPVVLNVFFIPSLEDSLVCITWTQSRYHRILFRFWPSNIYTESTNDRVHKASPWKGMQLFCNTFSPSWNFGISENSNLCHDIYQQSFVKVVFISIFLQVLGSRVSHEFESHCLSGHFILLNKTHLNSLYFNQLATWLDLSLIQVCCHYIWLLLGHLSPVSKKLLPDLDKFKHTKKRKKVEAWKARIQVMKPPQTIQFSMSVLNYYLRKRDLLRSPLEYFPC